MAQILIRSVDNDGTSPGVYKEGDAVVVMPDDHVWGKAENLAGGFYVLSVPGMSVANAQVWAETDEDVEPLPPALAAILSPAELAVALSRQPTTMVSRSKYKLGNAEFNYDANGKASVTQGQLIANAKRKR